MMRITGRAARAGARAYYNGLRRLGVPAMTRRLRNAGVILAYHNVVAAGDTGCGLADLHIGYEQFERQMNWLATHYEVVPLRDFVSRVAEGGRLGGTAVLTFDDAYAGVFEYAVPILDRLGLPATIFVVAEAPDRWNGFWWDQREEDIDDAPMPQAFRPASWRTIRAMRNPRIDIGVHSARHRSLPPLADEELDHEIVTSRSIVHAATGVWPEYFAYPYTHWDTRVRAAIRSAGYRAAVAGGQTLVASGANPWSLGRINVPAGISDAALEAWMAGWTRRGSRAGAPQHQQ